MIRPSHQFGPWTPSLDAAELSARLRGLRVIARLLAGPRSTDLCRRLAEAETDPAAIDPACLALSAMAASDKRQIWAAYAGPIRSAA